MVEERVCLFDSDETFTNYWPGEIWRERRRGPGTTYLYDLGGGESLPVVATRLRFSPLRPERTTSPHPTCTLGPLTRIPLFQPWEVIEYLTALLILLYHPR